MSYMSENSMLTLSIFDCLAAAVSLHSPSSSARYAGSSIMNSLPLPTSLFKEIFPPCNSIIDFTMHKPMPLPSLFLVKDESTCLNL